MPDVEIGIRIQLLAYTPIAVEGRVEVSACPLAGSVAQGMRIGVTGRKRESPIIPPGQGRLHAIVVRSVGVVNEGDIAQIRETLVIRVEWSA